MNKKWIRRINKGKRRCIKCGKVFSLNEIYFPHNRSRAGGFEYYCKKCACKRAIQRLKKIKTDKDKWEKWKQHRREWDRRYRKEVGSSKYRRDLKKILGRALLPNEIVHHIDGNNQNNNLRNLYIFKNPMSHNLYEANLKETYHKWIQEEINKN